MRGKMMRVLRIADKSWLPEMSNPKSKIRRQKWNAPA